MTDDRRKVLRSSVIGPRSTSPAPESSNPNSKLSIQKPVRPLADSKLTMQTILITGGAGFIDRLLVAKKAFDYEQPGDVKQAWANAGKAR